MAEETSNHIAIQRHPDIFLRSWWTKPGLIYIRHVTKKMTASPDSSVSAECVSSQLFA